MSAPVATARRRRFAAPVAARRVGPAGELQRLGAGRPSAAAAPLLDALEHVQGVVARRIGPGVDVPSLMAASSSAARERLPVQRERGRASAHSALRAKRRAGRRTAGGGERFRMLHVGRREDLRPLAGERCGSCSRPEAPKVERDLDAVRLLERRAQPRRRRRAGCRRRTPRPCAAAGLRRAHRLRQRAPPSQRTNAVGQGVYSAPALGKNSCSPSIL